MVFAHDENSKSWKSSDHLCRGKFIVVLLVGLISDENSSVTISLPHHFN